MGKLDHNLARGHDLAGFGERVDDDAIRVGRQDRVARFVPRHLGLGFRRMQFGGGRRRGRLRLLVGERRDGAVLHQSAITTLVRGRLRGARLERSNGLAARLRCQLEVHDIDTHQRLAALYRLAAVHEPGGDFARDTKAEVALHARDDDAGERSRGLDCRGGERNGHPRRQLPRVGLGLTTAGEGNRTGQGHGGESNDETVSVHKRPRALGLAAVCFASD